MRAPPRRLVCYSEYASPHREHPCQSRHRSNFLGLCQRLDARGLDYGRFCWREARNNSRS
jgi:hypothetical protein